jgi:hypothetical protein
LPSKGFAARGAGIMTVVVITAEGLEIRAEDALGALRALNERALIREADAWRYMLRVAQRARRATGQIIRSDDPTTFLQDMSAAGLLEVSGLGSSEQDAAK